MIVISVILQVFLICRVFLYNLHNIFNKKSQHREFYNNINLRGNLLPFHQEQMEMREKSENYFDDVSRPPNKPYLKPLPATQLKLLSYNNLNQHITQQFDILSQDSFYDYLGIKNGELKNVHFEDLYDEQRSIFFTKLPFMDVKINQNCNISPYSKKKRGKNSFLPTELSTIYENAAYS